MSKKEIQGGIREAGEGEFVAHGLVENAVRFDLRKVHCLCCRN